MGWAFYKIIMEEAKNGRCFIKYFGFYKDAWTYIYLVLNFLASLSYAYIMNS